MDDEDDFDGPAPPPLTATAADPTTKEGRALKVAVMAMRADMGKELHHPDDKRRVIAAPAWAPPMANGRRNGLSFPAGGGWRRSSTIDLE